MTSAPIRTGTRIVPVLCWLTLLADGYDLFVYGATLPALQAARPWAVGTGAAAAVASLALVGVMVGAITSGTLTDRFGRRRMLMVCVAAFSLAMLGCALAPSFAVFGAFRFLAGLGIGGAIPTVVAFVGEFARPETRSRTLGLVLTGPPIGGVVASVAAIGLLPAAGFRPVYALSVISLLILVPAWYLLPESPAYLRARGRTAEAAALATRFGLPAPEPTPPVERASAPRTGVRQLFAAGHLWPTVGIWVVMATVMLSTFGVSTWLPQAFRQAGYGLGSSLTFLLVYSAGAVVGTVIGAVLADRFGAKVIATYAFLLGAAGLVAMAVFDEQGALLAAAAIAGCGALVTQNMMNDHVGAFYPTSARATGLGWALGVGRLGAILGPLYGAVALTLASGEVNRVALLFAVPAVLGAVVIAVLPARRDVATPDASLLRLA